jgi:hypothetical protein
MNQLSRHCGILKISQPYRLPRLVMGITLLIYLSMIFVPHRKHTCVPPRCVTEIALLLVTFKLCSIFCYHRILITNFKIPLHGVGPVWHKELQTGLEICYGPRIIWPPAGSWREYEHCWEECHVGYSTGTQYAASGWLEVQSAQTHAEKEYLVEASSVW